MGVSDKGLIVVANLALVCTEVRFAVIDSEMGIFVVGTYSEVRASEV